MVYVGVVSALQMSLKIYVFAIIRNNDTENTTHPIPNLIIVYKNKDYAIDSPNGTGLGTLRYRNVVLYVLSAQLINIKRTASCLDIYRSIHSALRTICLCTIQSSEQRSVIVTMILFKTPPDATQ